MIFKLDGLLPSKSRRQSGSKDQDAKGYHPCQRPVWQAGKHRPIGTVLNRGCISAPPSKPSLRGFARQTFNVYGIPSSNSVIASLSSFRVRLSSTRHLLGWIACRCGTNITYTIYGERDTVYLISWSKPPDLPIGNAGSFEVIEQDLCKQGPAPHIMYRQSIYLRYLCKRSAVVCSNFSYLFLSMGKTSLTMLVTDRSLDAGIFGTLPV